VISDGWLEVPIGLNAERWVTREHLRTVLVVAHSVTALQRLLDVTPLFETDQRVQTVFTQGPGAFSNGVDRLISDIGAVAVPWSQAVRSTFDLALASGYTSLHELHAPIIVLPHGAGYNKFVPFKNGTAPATPIIYGLNPQQLIRDGRVVPSVIALSHSDELQILEKHCPDALPHAVVVGDPCADRILASRTRKSHYRASLGLSEHEKLLVLSSTWGPSSLFGSAPEVFDRAMVESLTSGYTVAALLHPGIWSGHGLRQVRSWFSRYRADGMRLVEPDEEWRAVLMGADWVIGDHGSTSLYSAAAGVPVVHIDVPSALVVPGSAMELLHSTTPALRSDSSVHAQLVRAAQAFDRSATDKVLQRITSAPEMSGPLIRRIVYEKLSLAEPPEPAVLPLLPAANRSA